MKAKAFLVGLLMVALAFAPITMYAGQADSNATAVSLSFTVSESLTLTSTPGSITFSTSGVASAPITATVNYNLSGGHSGGILVFSWFNSATQALIDGTGSIPPAGITGSVNSGTAHSCNSTKAQLGTNFGDFGTTGSGVFSTITFGVDGAFCDPIPVAGPFTTQANGTASGTLTLAIQGAASLPAGAYTGVLNQEAFIL